MPITYELVSAGITISDLFRQLTMQDTDCEGLLFGDVIIVSKDIADDTGEAITNTTVSIVLQSCQILGTSFSFYDQDGIDRKLIAQMRKQCNKTLLGWFKFRRNTPCRLSLRDKRVHDMFCRYYSRKVMKYMEDDVAQFLPVLGLFTTDMVDNVWGYNYRFFKSVAQRLVLTPMCISNLKKSSKDEYEELNVLSSFSYGKRQNETFGSLLEYMKVNMQDALKTPPDDVVALENVFRETLDTIQHLQQQIIETEREIAKYEKRA